MLDPCLVRTADQPGLDGGLDDDGRRRPAEGHGSRQCGRPAPSMSSHGRAFLRSARTRRDQAESEVTVAGLGDHPAGVSGATCNSRQIGSPPKRSRWVPMKRVISAVPGRAPVRNKPGPPSASHWRGTACDARAQACRSRSRSPVVSALVRPKFEAIEVVVAHCNACSAWCSNTIRTFPLADSLLGTRLAMSSPHPLQGIEPPSFRERFTAKRV